MGLALVFSAGGVHDAAAAAQVAEGAGFESVWATEFYDRSATIALAAMAGVTRRRVGAAGAVADGLVGHPLFTPEYVNEVVWPALERGAGRAGRERRVPIAGYLTCSIDPDRERARNEARAIVAFNSTVK